MGMKTGQKIEKEQNIHIRQKAKVIFSKIAGKLTAASPALFAVLVTFLVLWNQYNSRVTLTNLEMNLIFFAMFAISLILTVWAHANRRKCIWLIGMSVAIIEVYFYNRLDSSDTFFMDLIRFWSGFNNVWSKLLLLMLIYLLIVGIRVVRWSQEDWEEIQKFRREKRKQKVMAFWEECKECWSAFCDKRKWIRVKKRIQSLFWANEERKEQEAAAERREQHRIAYKEELEINLRQRKYLQGVRHRKEREKAERDNSNPSQNEKEINNTVKTVLAVGIMLLIVAFYVFIPYGVEGNQGKGWMNHVRQVVRELENKTGSDIRTAINFPKDFSDTLLETILSAVSNMQVGFRRNNTIEWEQEQEYIQQASEEREVFSSVLAKYTIFFIALAGIIYVGIILLYRLAIQWIEQLQNKNNSKTGLSEFFNEYSTPVSVLIVATAMLATFVGKDEWAPSKLPELFKNMASIVLCILLALITVDAVRLILKQCVKKGSLLRTAMHLTFVFLIDCVMGIIVGVMSELNIRGVISSLFAFFLQGNRTMLYNKAEEVLDEALDEEIGTIRCEMQEQQGTSAYRHVNRIRYRRRKKEQSAFQKFHHKTKGRRN